MPKYRIIKDGYSFSRVGDDRKYTKGDIVEMSSETFLVMPIGNFELVIEKRIVKKPNPKDVLSPNDKSNAEKEIWIKKEIDKIMSLRGRAIIDYAKSRNIKFGRGCYSVKKRKQKLIDWVEAQ